MSNIVQTTELIHELLAAEFPDIPVTRNYLAFVENLDQPDPDGRINVAPIWHDFDEQTNSREWINQQIIFVVGFRKQFAAVPTTAEIDACIEIVERFARLFTARTYYQTAGGNRVELARFTDAKHDDTYAIYDPEILAAENRFVGLVQVSAVIKVDREPSYERGE